MGCCASDEGNTYLPKPVFEHQPKPVIEQERVVKSVPKSVIQQQQVIKPIPSNPTPPTTITSQLFSGELGQASLSFKYQSFQEAAEIYKQYIVKHVNEVVQIDGLGQNELSIGYYEWDLYQWYKEGIESGMYKGTVYDALSLCYLALKANADQIEKGIKWYRQMVDNFPENYPLIFGYANILSNKLIFEEAIDYYNKAIELKPNWVKPLQCLGYIYEYKRIQKAKSIEISKKILAIQPNNFVALFILARNESVPDTKIEKLKQMLAIYPRYARAINQIGIVYGGTKKEYQNAIEWYKKCLEVTPKYASCYNNIGVNYELLKQYDEAMVWYFKGIEKDKEYKAPHDNLKDVFAALNYTDDDIDKQIKKYNVFPDYFYYYLGLTHHDKKKYDNAIKYYNKSYSCIKDLGKQIYKIHNSMGITYDELKDNEQALSYYFKCIQNNPKYFSAYYNAAIVYKRQKDTDKAIEWYKKAIKVNVRYSYAYNNLGNIYKDKGSYDDAIKSYRKAVQHNSTYTLAYANLGVCCIRVENYREAFNAFQRAKELLPTDNNNLSEGNKTYMKDQLAKFDQQGQNWRQSGGITPELREKLNKLIKSFEKNFENLYANKFKENINLDKVLKPQILELIQIVYEDRFELTRIDKIYDLVKDLFEDNEDYFHIIPQLFMQYFYNNAFIKNRPILQIEEQLYQITKRLSAKTNEGIKKVDPSQEKSRQTVFKMVHFDPPTEFKVNLFKEKFFSDYTHVYGQIISVNELAAKSYHDYKELVDYARKQSYGIPYGIGMKIPKSEKDQFKVILRIFEKMFKKEIDSERVKSIIGKVDASLKQKKKEHGEDKISIGAVVHDIMEIWTKEITDIVVDRKKKSIETACAISDFLRAKIMFESVDHMKKAIAAIDQMCNTKNFKVLQMENRLAKQQTQDVVLKIQVRDAVCELQLAMKQEESQYHFIHSIYEIERSPLGCIFGSYIFMSKGFSYTFLENCQDIEKHLKDTKDPGELKTLQAAKYIASVIGENR